MFSLVIGAILAVAAIIALLVRTKVPKVDRYGHSNTARPILGIGGIVGFLIAAALVITSFFHYVEPRTVAVETEWGKYTRTLESGLHPAAPWAKTAEFPTTFEVTGVDAPIGFDGGDRGTQHVDLTWQITSAEAKALWEKYREFDRVKSELIEREVKDESNKVLSGYTPDEAVESDNQEPIREDIQAALTKELAPYGITVDSLAAPAVDPDDKAQGRIDRVQDANTDAERAAINLKAAKDEAEADKIRNQEATPNSIALECLEITNRWNDDENGQLPDMWNCVGPQSASPVKVVGQD